MKTMKRTLLAFASFVLVSLVPDIVLSCPVCFGDKASAEVEGAKWAILFLLGVTGTVLSGVVSFMVYLRKRTKMNFAETEQLHLNREL